MPDYPNQHLIDELYRNLKGQEPGNGNGNGHRKHAPAIRSDEQIIEKCRKARNAPKFASLFDDGDLSGYGGDDSAADFGLLGIFKYYTQNPDQLEMLMNRSALRRPKWDEPRAGVSWLRYSINNALGEGSEESYRQNGTGTGTPISNGSGSGSRRLSSTSFAEMPTPGPRRYLVEGLVPEAYPTMIYGDGGVAKSMLALSLGLAVAAGSGTWLGRAIESGAVLYVDFELDAPEQMRRVSQLSRAEGIDTLPAGLRYMSAVGVCARDAFQAALEECKEHNVKLLIVDSLGPALEGDAEASRDVIAFYNEVVGPFRTAGVAPLVIDHQSKLQGGERYQNKRAFGSVFKSNLARSVMQVEATERGEGSLTVRIRQNKHNFGTLLQPFGARFGFSSEQITVDHVELEEGDLAEEGTLNARDRVRMVLNTLGEATRSEIHEQVSDLSPGTVRKELTRLCGSEAAEWTGEVRERQQVARLTGTGTGTYKGSGSGSGSENNEPDSDGLFKERF